MRSNDMAYRENVDRGKVGKSQVSGLVAAIAQAVIGYRASRFNRKVEVNPK